MPILFETSSPIIFYSKIVANALLQPIFLWKLYCGYRNLGGTAEVCRRVRDALLWLRGRPAEAVDDAEDSEVLDLARQVLDARRVCFARTSVRVMWAAFCLYYFVDIVLSTQPKRSERLVRWIAGLFIWSSLTIGVLYPSKFITIRSLPCWLWGGTVTICLLTSFSPNAGATTESLLFSWPLMESIAISFGGFYLHFRSLVVSSFLMTVAYVVAYVRTERTCENNVVELREIVCQSLYMWLWKVALFYWSERSTIYSVRKEVDAALGKCQGSGVSALLEMICDAVVDLDQNFVLKDHYNKLAGLLMTRSGRSLRGIPFSNFVAPGEDQRRFQEIARTGDTAADSAAVADNAAPAEPTPSMMKVRLRDSMGNFFSAALYHMPYLSVHGRMHHLIGLQEDSREGAHGAAGERGSQFALHTQRPMPEAMLRKDLAKALGKSGGAGGDNGESPRRASSCSDDSRTGSLSVGSSDLSEGAEVVLGHLVVIADDRLTIMALDPSVQERLGLTKAGEDVPGGCFTDATPDDGGTLAKRIVDVAKLVMRGERPPHTCCFGEWRLAKEGSRPGHYEVRVDFRSPAEEVDPSQQLVKIRLVVPPPPQISRSSKASSNGWRNRRGPLRASRSKHAAPKQVSL